MPRKYFALVKCMDPVASGESGSSGGPSGGHLPPTGGSSAGGGSGKKDDWWEKNPDYQEWFDRTNWNDEGCSDSDVPVPGECCFTLEEKRQLVKTWVDMLKRTKALALDPELRTCLEDAWMKARFGCDKSGVNPRAGGYNGRIVSVRDRLDLAESYIQRVIDQKNTAGGGDISVSMNKGQLDKSIDILAVLLTLCGGSSDTFAPYMSASMLLDDKDYEGFFTCAAWRSMVSWRKNEDGKGEMSDGEYLVYRCANGGRFFAEVNTGSVGILFDVCSGKLYRQRSDSEGDLIEGDYIFLGDRSALNVFNSKCAFMYLKNSPDGSEPVDGLKFIDKIAFYG